MMFITADGRTFNPSAQGHVPIFTNLAHPDLPFASASVCAEHFQFDVKSIRAIRLDDYLAEQAQEEQWAKAS